MVNAEHWLYKPDYDAEITALVKEKRWGAYRIYNHLTAKYGKQVMGIATVQRRVAQLKKQAV